MLKRLFLRSPKSKIEQTFARLILLSSVEIENETSEGQFCKSRMRMKVLGDKLRVENESLIEKESAIFV